jgi:hypothetical protein
MRLLLAFVPVVRHIHAVEDDAPLASSPMGSLHVASAAEDPVCHASSFPTNLSGLQCLNMENAAAAKTPSACLAACCGDQGRARPSSSLGRCNKWNFAVGQQSCWLGFSVEECSPPTGTWKVWVGGSKLPSPPPPPGPLPPPPPSPGPPPGPTPTIHIDTRADGPRFYGIGAISGGGATTRVRCFHTRSSPAPLALLAPHRTARTWHFVSQSSEGFTFKHHLCGALSAQYASSATLAASPTCRISLLARQNCSSGSTCSR